MPEEVSVASFSYEEESETRAKKKKKEKNRKDENRTRSIQSSSWKEKRKEERKQNETSDDQRKKGKTKKVEGKDADFEAFGTWRGVSTRRCCLRLNLRWTLSWTCAVVEHNDSRRQFANCSPTAVWRHFSELSSSSSLATMLRETRICSKRGTRTHRGP